MPSSSQVVYTKELLSVRSNGFPIIQHLQGSFSIEVHSIAVVRVSHICRIFPWQKHWRGGTQEFRWTLMLCPCLLALQLFLHFLSMPALIRVLPLHLRNHSGLRLKTQTGVSGPTHWFILSQGLCSFTVLLRTQSLSQSLRKWDHCHKESCWKGAGAIKSKTEECSNLWGQNPPGWAPKWITLVLQQLLK